MSNNITSNRPTPSAPILQQQKCLDQLVAAGINATDAKLLSKALLLTEIQLDQRPDETEVDSAYRVSNGDFLKDLTEVLANNNDKADIASRLANFFAIFLLSPNNPAVELLRNDEEGIFLSALERNLSYLTDKNQENLLYIGLGHALGLEGKTVDEVAQDLPAAEKHRGLLEKCFAAVRHLQEPPIEEPKPKEEQPAPVEESKPKDEQPIEEPKPQEEQQPIEEPKPKEEQPPVEEPKPQEEQQPIEEPKPQEEQQPPIEESKPKDEQPPIEEPKPKDEQQPIEEPKPKDEQPIEESKPQDEQPPVEEPKPQEEEAPIEEPKPKEQQPIEEPKPKEEEAPIEEPKPQEEQPVDVKPEVLQKTKSAAKKSSYNFDPKYLSGQFTKLGMDQVNSDKMGLALQNITSAVQWLEEEPGEIENDSLTEIRRSLDNVMKTLDNAGIGFLNRVMLAITDFFGLFIDYAKRSSISRRMAIIAEKRNAFFDALKVLRENLYDHDQVAFLQELGEKIKSNQPLNDPNQPEKPVTTQALESLELILQLKKYNEHIIGRLKDLCAAGELPEDDKQLILAALEEVIEEAPDTRAEILQAREHVDLMCFSLAEALGMTEERANVYALMQNYSLKKETADFLSLAIKKGHAQVESQQVENEMEPWLMEDQQPINDQAGPAGENQQPIDDQAGPAGEKLPPENNASPVKNPTDEEVKE